jgi:TetR/AcrR family transcriptional regulator, fatty acid biosynthesis regulator
MTKSMALTRREAKAVTRRRLLDAALAILDEGGEAGLTTVAVTRRAGIAQSTFYVHFADVDDLLHGLVEELAAERSRLTRAARRAARARRDAPSLRETFRVPLGDLLAHPRLSRLLLTSRSDDSPIGRWSREIHQHSREALIEDLAAAGLPMETAGERRRAAMIADALIGMTEALALGHMEGRYTDVEEMVDTLVLFSSGYLGQLAR